MNQLTTEQWLVILQLAGAAALASAQASGADPTIVGYIQTGLDAAIAGIAAVRQAQTAVNPDSLHDISEV